MLLPLPCRPFLGPRLKSRKHQHGHKCNNFINSLQFQLYFYVNTLKCIQKDSWCKSLVCTCEKCFYIKKTVNQGRKRSCKMQILLIALPDNCKHTKKVKQRENYLSKWFFKVIFIEKHLYFRSRTVEWPRVCVHVCVLQRRLRSCYNCR